MIFCRTFMVAVLLLFGLIGYSQEKISKKNLKKSDQLFASGLKILEEGGDVAAAESLLVASLRYNSSNIQAIRTMADLKFQSKDYASATMWIKKILEVDSSLIKQVLTTLIKAELGCGHFDQAIEQLEKSFRRSQIDSKNYEYYKSGIQFAKAASQKNISNNLSIKNLGSNINSTASEYFPSISSSDSMMIITRRIGNGQNEDFFGSIKFQSNWQVARPLEGKINTAFNEGGQKISPDGKWMVFTGCNYPEGFGSCDIYIAENINGTWSERKNMGTPVNTEYWESAPCLSPDKSSIYFSSNRPGGYGGMDIYVAYLNDKGDWGAPQNLGPSINTSGDELFPFIHFDNTTLYFTSNGWKSIGGSDIYVSKKIGNNFHTPVNLGFPINTIDNESGLVVNAAGKIAYFSSDRFGGEGGMDIYEFSLPTEVQAFPIKKTEAIVLKDILFKTAKWNLEPSSFESLNAVITFLTSNPSIRIQINGHTDNIGKEDANLQLSTMRAKSVVDYFKQNGIAENRLDYKGFGSTQPIGDNLTEEGRAKNRRTEMLILSN